MTFYPVKIAEGEPGRSWHMNDDCDVRVDTFFVLATLGNTLHTKNAALGVLVLRGTVSLDCPSEENLPDLCCRPGHTESLKER